MTDSDAPFFRFNPDAYLPGRAFESSDAPCDVCSRPCTWRYTGGIYARVSPIVCARCIADGRAARHLSDPHAGFHDSHVEGAIPELKEELLRRTPGVACFNPFDWPVLDGKPLAFLGYGEDEALISSPDARSAIEAAFEEIGWEFEGPSPYILLFKEIDGGRFRAVIDLD